MRTRISGTLAVAVLALVLAGPAWAADGSALYTQRCAGCHGAQGEGSGAFPPLRGNPVSADEQAVRDLVTSGGGGMPAFGYLADEEVDALVSHVLTTWGGVAEPGSGAGDGGTPPAAPGDATAGAAVYTARCASCHGDTGEGRGTYPPVVGSGVLGEPAALEELITRGRGGMPAFADLPAADVADLVAYLIALGGPSPGPATTETTVPEAPALVGDALRGERLFTGRDAFANGGGSCLACHAIGAGGAVSGGTLGTDLSDAGARYGSETALAGVLETPAFAVMRSAYADAPLEPQEAADIAAYLVGLSPGADGGSVLTDRFWVFGGAATLVMFVVMGIVASRRRPGLAQQIREARRQGRGA